MTTFISNAFSLNMVDDLDLCCLTIRPCTEAHARAHMGDDYVSVVGHEDTARLLDVAFNRTTVKLERGDTLFVAQYSGTRLPEGATTLPEGASLRWVQVLVEEPDVDAAVFACNQSGWSDDAIKEFVRGVTREEGYYLGYVLGVVSDIGVCLLETRYQAAINRVVKAARRLDFPELLEFLHKAYRGFAERRRLDGEKSDTTIRYEFSAALEAVGLKPATTK